METLSCYTNVTPRAATIRNTTHVEAYIMNLYAMYQLHPIYAI